MGDGAIEMHLALELADAVVQLSCYGESLIGGCIAGPNEWGVVSRYLCDVSVASLAEFDIVIAGCGIRGLGR